MYNDNPQISKLLYWVTFIETLVLLGAGGGLLLFPSLIGPLWPWDLLPFNAVLLGAVYTASLMATAITVYVKHWAPTRVVVPMIFLFTTVVLVVSLVNIDRFDFGRFGTWLWFLLYIGIPANAAYSMWLTRKQQPYFPYPIAKSWRIVLLLPIIILGVYGVGLLVAPETLSSFWPWPIDAFHGRMYSVLYLTPGLGALLLWRAAASIEMLTLGITLAVGGLVPIVGVPIVNMGLDKVDWSLLGTRVWIGTFTVLFLTGLGIIGKSRSQERPRDQTLAPEA
jgi:hypothetical protein